jgi:hypothetical protein
MIVWASSCWRKHNLFALLGECLVPTKEDVVPRIGVGWPTDLEGHQPETPCLHRHKVRLEVDRYTSQLDMGAHHASQ